MVKNIRSLLFPFVTFCIILGVASIIIAIGRGYRLDIQKNSLRPTGLISATSDPIGAQVYVDGVLKTATNNSFGIDPGWYKITVSKESYISWEKNVRVQGEIVSNADAYLFPSNASLSPLTTNGVTQPTLSPDGVKIAYIVPKTTSNAQNIGLWVFELSDSPLGRNRDPIHIDTRVMDGATITWSPDALELLVEIPSTTTFIYAANRANAGAIISDLEKKSLVRDWSNLHDQKILTQLTSFKQPIIDVATSSARIIAFAPDESKILYEATASATIPQIIIPSLIGTNPTEEQRTISKGNIYVYDAKEDRNYFLIKKTELPNAKPLKPIPLLWFPTSNHVMIVFPEKIDIMEFDRTNWITVYSGPFDSTFVTPWPNGSRIVILTSLNTKAATIPNLYTVNLR